MLTKLHTVGLDRITGDQVTASVLSSLAVRHNAAAVDELKTYVCLSRSANDPNPIQVHVCGTT
jgi:hypothetical protein